MDGIVGAVVNQPVAFAHRSQYTISQAAQKTGETVALLFERYQANEEELIEQIIATRILGAMNWRLVLALLVALVATIVLAWWSMIRMPGKNPSNTASLSAADIILRDELEADVQHLASDIGERNLSRYPQLNTAAEFIEKSFRQAGLQPRRDSYEVNGLASHNVEVEIPGASPEIVLAGAHYDSVFGAPGSQR